MRPEGAGGHPGAGHFGQVEVENFGVAALDDENVGGLDVAVNDAFAVRGIQRVGHLNGEIQHGVEIYRLADNQVLQRLAEGKVRLTR